jgi:hypothetical protein
MRALSNSSEFKRGKEQNSHSTNVVEQMECQWAWRLSSTISWGRMEDATRRQTACLDFRRHRRSNGLAEVHRNHLLEELQLTSGLCHLSPYIHSTTLEDAIACAELLAGFHDGPFEKMKLWIGSLQVWRRRSRSTDSILYRTALVPVLCWRMTTTGRPEMAALHCLSLGVRGRRCYS